MIDPRAILVGLVLLSAVAGGIWLYRQGGESVVISIERQNNEAGNSADRGRDDFDLCPHGLWDFGAGKCRRP